MTDITVNKDRVGPILAASADAGLRFPDITGSGPPSSPTRTLVYTPDLTAPEQATFDAIAKTATGAALMTPTEYAALSSFLSTGRSFLGLSQADFIALTQNARDRMLFDNVSALWRVIFRLLRDT